MISPDNEKVAAGVRLNLYDYTIAVNDVTWNKTYQLRVGAVISSQTEERLLPLCVWRGSGLWRKTAILSGAGHLSNCGIRCTARTEKIAAIVAPKFGKWTVAVDGKPWSADIQHHGHGCGF